MKDDLVYRHVSAFGGCRPPGAIAPGIGEAIGTALGKAIALAWRDVQLANPHRPLTALEVRAAIFGEPIGPGIVVPWVHYDAQLLTAFNTWTASLGTPREVDVPEGVTIAALQAALVSPPASLLRPPGISDAQAMAAIEVMAQQHGLLCPRSPTAGSC